jgi:hypothetical protein
MNICLVEDDYLQADWISAQISKRFKTANVQIIKTEQKFRAEFQKLVQSPPAVFVIDVMLRWTDPSPTMESPPKDVQVNGFYRAGVRCAKMLAANPKTKKSRVILFTVLEKTDLEDDLKTLGKGLVHIRKDADLSPLMTAICDVSD